MSVISTLGEIIIKEMDYHAFCNYTISNFVSSYQHLLLYTEVDFS
jgi:hypothetical protein